MNDGLDYYGVVLDAIDENQDDSIDVILIDEHASKQRVVAYRRNFKKDDFMIGDVVVYHIRGIHHVTQAKYKKEMALYDGFKTLLIDYFELGTGQTRVHTGFLDDIIYNLSQLSVLERELWTTRFLLNQRNDW